MHELVIIETGHIDARYKHEILNFIYCLFLYGCETWSVTLREEDGLRVFENRVLREMFGRNRDVVTGEWRRLHNEELYDFYCSRILG